MARWGDRYPVTVAGTAPDYRYESCFRVPYYFHFWKPVAWRPYAAAAQETSVNSANVTFFLGGARSGKSRMAQALAETLADSSGLSPVYLATGQAFDAEMTDRIARHRADRGPRWRTVDCPVDLPAAIGREAVAGNIVLVDCLTLWASNLLLAEADTAAADEALLAALAAAKCPVSLVSNEVGLGIVPDNALARRFRDDVGRLHQSVATLADAVYFVAAGLALPLKQPPAKPLP